MAETKTNPGAAATASGADSRHSSEERRDYRQAGRKPQRWIAFEKLPELLAAVEQARSIAATKVAPVAHFEIADRRAWVTPPTLRRGAGRVA